MARIDNTVTVSYQYVTPAVEAPPEDTVEPSSELSSRAPWTANDSPPLPEDTSSPDASPAAPPIVVTPLKHRNVTALTPQSRNKTPEVDAASDTSSQSSRGNYYYLNTDIPRTSSPAEARKTGFRCLQCRKRYPRSQYSLNQQKKLPSNSARCKECVKMKQEWH